ncbi:MAG TPA: MBL fold metallo-hydrolase [Actinomycetota bacterium]|nr:MBL fold metallo-hydrolase [Actinomycetota bacterium]
MLQIRRVLAPNPGPYTLDGTNTWIVGADPSIVIDPGPDDEGHLTDVVREAGAVGAILVTHDHPDHAPGAAPFARRVGGTVHAIRLAGAEPLRAGQRIRAGSTELTVVPTPGHSSDHVAFFEPATGAMFTGDAVLGRGTSFIDPPEGDLVRYLRSLSRMRELHPRTIHPGHGPVVLDAGAKLREYLTHRQEREEQVLDALSDGPRSVAEIVAVIYAAYPKDVHPLAARSVLAHLLKLADEGRVDRSDRSDGGTWSLAATRTCARCGRPVRARARYCHSCSLAILQAD